MKKNLLALLFCLSAMFSFSVKSNAQGTLIYYWNFNGGDSSMHAPNYTVTGAGSATYEYWCAYTDYAAGSSINIQPGYVAGNCIRFRQPSDSVTFIMPTTGYKNIKFSYAEQRTNSGSATNTVLFSTDGVNFIPTTVADVVDSSTYTVDSTDAISGDTTEFQLRTYNFSTDTSVNNNLHFAVTIVFVGGPDSTSGNDRFDNFTLNGTPLSTTGVPVVQKSIYSLSPNPASDFVEINGSTEGNKTVAVTNTIGQRVAEEVVTGTHFSVNTANLNPGVYFISIKENTTGEVNTMKFIKQ